MRGALYIRVSTDDQTEYSPDSQIKLCYKYAKEHNIDILEEYIFKENGISGTNVEKREEFKKMITVAKTKPKPFDVILVYSFSRFARNREDSIMYKSLLRKKLGIEVISITQPLSEGKESILMEALYEAMDEYYSVDLSEQSRRGKLEKASRGEHQGKAPFGYDYDKNKKLIVPNDKAKIVRFIFEEWCKEGVGYRTLMRKLNQMKADTPAGIEWNNRNLRRMLHNPTYMGYSRYTDGGLNDNFDNPKSIIVKGKHKPIISEELYNKAMQKLRLHDKKYYCYKLAEPTSIWTRGLLKCGFCGATMTRCNLKTKAAFYQCSRYIKGNCPTSNYLREDVLIPTLLEEIKNTFQKKIDIKIKIQESNQDNEIEIIEQQIRKLEIKKERVRNAYLNEVDTLEEYKKNKLSLEKDIKELKKQIKQIQKENKIETKEEKVYSLCKTAYEILSDENSPMEQKTIIAHQLFDNIVYDKTNNKLIITYK